ncbi:hypothetical protein yrohd0001_16670 [Yersinia rohdei ATCC 43380]|nr:hypothetical protein yrohd0001_16670 [Yersinia rohdei ATCC 43380]
MGEYWGGSSRFLTNVLFSCRPTWVGMAMLVPTTQLFLR